MSNQKEPLVKLTPVEQVAIVVKDMDKAVQFYSSTFGWGPFQVMDTGDMDVTYNGKLEPCQIKLAFARSGDVEIELIQPVKGKTPHADFLAAKGEGAHHLRFKVDNLESTLAALAKGGIEPVWHASSAGVNFAYVYSDQVGGVMFELIEWKTDPPA